VPLRRRELCPVLGFVWGAKVEILPILTLKVVDLGVVLALLYAVFARSYPLFGHFLRCHFAGAQKVCPCCAPRNGVRMRNEGRRTEARHGRANL